MTNQKFINNQCKAIGKLDKIGIEEKELRNMIYKPGVYVYREFHDAGIPADMLNPSLDAQKKVWSSAEGRYIDESLKEVCMAV